MTDCPVSLTKHRFDGAVALYIGGDILGPGFGHAHGWRYIPGVWPRVTAITGFCTGKDISRRLFPFKPPVGL